MLFLIFLASVATIEAILSRDEKVRRGSSAPRGGEVFRPEERSAPAAGRPESIASLAAALDDFGRGPSPENETSVQEVRGGKAPPR